MEQSQELSKALEELTLATGIALDIHIQPEASKENESAGLTRLSSLWKLPVVCEYPKRCRLPV